MRRITPKMESELRSLWNTNRPAYDYADGDSALVPEYRTSARRAFMLAVACLYPKAIANLLGKCRPYYEQRLSEAGIQTFEGIAGTFQIFRTLSDDHLLRAIVEGWQQEVNLLSDIGDDPWVTDLALLIVLADATVWAAPVKGIPLKDVDSLAVLVMLKCEHLRATSVPVSAYLRPAESPPPFELDSWSPGGSPESEAEYNNRMDRRFKEHRGAYVKKQKELTLASGFEPRPTSTKQFDHYEALAHYQVGNVNVTNIGSWLHKDPRTIRDARDTTAALIGLRLRAADPLGRPASPPRAT